MSPEIPISKTLVYDDAALRSTKEVSGYQFLRKGTGAGAGGIRLFVVMKAVSGNPMVHVQLGIYDQEGHQTVWDTVKSKELAYSDEIYSFSTEIAANARVMVTLEGPAGSSVRVLACG